MTPSGALAITGAVFLLLAVVCAFVWEGASTFKQARYGLAGWATLSVAALCFITAAWWGTLG